MLTFSHGKGLFVFALPALEGLILAPAFVRRKGGLGAWLLLLPVIPLCFYAKYSYWEGGYSWGPRYLVPAVAFWLLPPAFWTPRRMAARAAYRAAFCFSAAIEAVGVTVSFLECQVERGYYDENFRFDLGYSAVTETWSVVLHYLREGLRGRFLSEPQGMGFDRWFFFLAKEGLPAGWLAAAALAIALLLGLSVWLLQRTVSTHEEGVKTVEVRERVAA